MDHTNSPTQLRKHNSKRNFLAFMHNFWYCASISEPSSKSDMGATKKTLVKQFRGVTLATALLVAPLQACGEEASSAEPTQVAANTNRIEILRDAHRPANAWVVGHDDRIAISVRLGAQSQVPPERMAEVLAEDFAGCGADNIRFFFEEGAPAGSVVAYHSDHYVWGPYPLADSREHVCEAVDGVRFNQEIALNNS